MKYNRLKVVVLISVTMLCGNLPARSEPTTLKLASPLSMDAKQRLDQTKKSGKMRKRADVLFVEPSLDVLADQAAAISVKSLKLNMGQIGLKAAHPPSLGTISLRTQTIQLLRDGYFRVCEAYKNGAIDKIQYKDFFSKND